MLPNASGGRRAGTHVPARQSSLRLRVAQTPAERERGLSDVTFLPDGEGMLFAFPGSTRGAFWNRRTLIPLSIAFLDKDLRVLEMRDMRSLAETGGRIETYAPSQVYRYALEVPRGWFARRGVRVGDRLVPA